MNIKNRIKKLKNLRDSTSRKLIPLLDEIAQFYLSGDLKTITQVEKLLKQSTSRGVGPKAAQNKMEVLQKTKFKRERNNTLSLLLEQQIKDNKPQTKSRFTHHALGNSFREIIRENDAFTKNTKHQRAIFLKLINQ